MRGSSLLLLGLLGLLACARGNGSAASDAAPASSDTGATAPSDLKDYARAEELRRSADIPEDVFTSADLQKRRRAARALARIADTRAAETLAAGLHSSDAETLTWSAYGLGYACKGREEKHIRALVARSLTLDVADAPPFTPRLALVRAIARCGTPLAETVLTRWLVEPAFREAAAVGLGDLAVRQKGLGADAMTALLDAAPGDATHPPLDLALYPISRSKVDPTFAERILTVAQGALARTGDARIFAVRALSRGSFPPAGKSGGTPQAAKVIAEVVGSSAFTLEERAEAARALGQLGESGKSEAADLLPKVAPGKDPFAIGALGGATFGIVASLLNVLAEEPPKSAEPMLFALADLSAPGDPPPTLKRRVAMLRCGAALALARGSFETDVLQKCDTKGTEIWERARLASLVRRPLLKERKTAWTELAHSTHVRVREAAIEALEGHPELDAAGRTELAAALEAKEPGMVATAAEVLFKHPTLAFALADRERKAALDPHAPPPTANPEKELDAKIAKALRGSLGRAWSEDLVETRALLLDAAAALHLAEAKPAALRACKDPNVTMRLRADAALRALGEKDGKCTYPGDARNVDLPAPPPKNTKLTFVTDSGELGIVLEPELAPVTTARILALAKSGFYKGVSVHRVVPAFVVQFGDPGGDGYGGSGTLLRCETSPVPFGPRSVGIALAGRDTGSSQLFVTLTRTPHLDGEYTWVGHAEGDWSSVAEDDVISDVKIAE
ncbi:MAG: peptidylprolyl isomerase [Polyangiaceae bacterium]|nr:peptidylprolyl isomerase [Polyangiaceae bacterium]